MLSPRIRLLLLASLLLLFLIAFLDKPVHIDDTVFLKTAEFLTKHPLQPFGAEINWMGTSKSIFYEDNPFLICYYFALVMTTLGKSEMALHASYLVFPFLALFSCFGVAKCTGTNPVLGTALLLSCPAFLVSSTTLMGDVPLIAFYLLSCYFYLRFCQNERPLDGWLFAVSICLASFTKYIGLTLIPLFLVDSGPRGLLRKTSSYLTFPVFLFLFWCVYNFFSMGAIHLLEAGKSMNFGLAEIMRKIVASLSFTGLSILGFVMFSRRFTVREILLQFAVAIVAAVIIFKFSLAHSLVNTIFMSLGMSATFAAMVSIYRPPRDRFLLIWFSGMFVYCWLAEFIAARVVLYFAPPLVLLLSRRLSGRIVVPALLLNFLLSFWIATEDARFAAVYKSLAQTLPAQGTRYIAHWGFQYYMEERGVPPFDYERDHLQKGDLIIVPKIAGTSLYPIPAQEGRFLNASIVLKDRIEFNVHRGMFLMNPENDAGFYCHGWGMLPYSFGTGATEAITLYKVSEIAPSP